MKGIEPIGYSVDVDEIIERFENKHDGLEVIAQFTALANFALRKAGVQLEVNRLREYRSELTSEGGDA